MELGWVVGVGRESWGGVGGGAGGTWWAVCGGVVRAGGHRGRSCWSVVGRGGGGGVVRAGGMGGGAGGGEGWGAWGGRSKWSGLAEPGPSVLQETSLHCLEEEGRPGPRALFLGP